MTDSPAKQTKSFVWLLAVFVLIVLGSAVFYRLQLLLGENSTVTTKSFFNPFLPQRLASKPVELESNPFEYENPFDYKPEDRPYRNPFELSK